MTQQRMTAMADPNPIPPYAITCWTNDRDIFVALPCAAGGIPYIMSYALNEGGLSLALEVLRKRPKEVVVPSAAQPANYTRPPAQPQVKTTKAAEKLKAETTEAQRENARRVLAKMGIK